MYKRLSGFMKATGEGVPASRYEVPAAPRASWAVLYFRIRKDNRKVERVFRFIRSFDKLKAAEICFEQTKAPLKLLLVGDGSYLRQEGDMGFLKAWEETREGLNKGKHPLFGKGYGFRKESTLLTWVGTYPTR